MTGGPADRGKGSDVHRLDVTGLHCPLPILRTRKALDRLPAGARLVVTATDPASVIDFRHFCNTTEHELEGWTEVDGVFTYRLRRGPAGEPHSGARSGSGLPAGAPSGRPAVSR